MNQTDHMCFVEFFECVLKCTTCSFGGKSFSPILSGKSPADFKGRPPDWIEEADATHEVTRCFLFHRKVSIAAHMPVSDMKREIAPRFESVQWFASEVPHDFRIGAHVSE